MLDCDSDEIDEIDEEDDHNLDQDLDNGNQVKKIIAKPQSLLSLTDCCKNPEVNGPFAQLHTL